MVADKRPGKRTLQECPWRRTWGRSVPGRGLVPIPWSYCDCEQLSVSLHFTSRWFDLVFCEFSHEVRKWRCGCPTGKTAHQKWKEGMFLCCLFESSSVLLCNVLFLFVTWFFRSGKRIAENCLKLWFEHAAEHVQPPSAVTVGHRKLVWEYHCQEPSWSLSHPCRVQNTGLWCWCGSSSLLAKDVESRSTGCFQKGLYNWEEIQWGLWNLLVCMLVTDSPSVGLVRRV